MSISLTGTSISRKEILALLTPRRRPEGSGSSDPILGSAPAGDDTGAKHLGPKVAPVL